MTESISHPSPPPTLPSLDERGTLPPSPEPGPTFSGEMQSLHLEKLPGTHTTVFLISFPPSSLLLEPKQTCEEQTNTQGSQSFAKSYQQKMGAVYGNEDPGSGKEKCNVEMGLRFLYF